MNGISDIATRHDLADRCVIVHLPPIKAGKRMTERGFWQKWESAARSVRAALFNAVSAALRNTGGVHITLLRTLSG